MPTSVSPRMTTRSSRSTSWDGRPEGEVLRSNRRLYMQLHAPGDCTDVALLIAALDAAKLPGTLSRHQRPARRRPVDLQRRP
ncbi:MAG: hypothetical protein R3A10_07370 [Caldilineaceae bacterium]